MHEDHLGIKTGKSGGKSRCFSKKIRAGSLICNPETSRLMMVELNLSLLFIFSSSLARLMMFSQYSPTLFSRNRTSSTETVVTRLEKRVGVATL